MLSQTLVDALNEQIRHEFNSSYLYLAMAAQLESVSLSGAAHWMRLQSQEEWAHGMKIFGYLIDRGARVTLRGLAEPPGEFPGLTGLFEQVLAHERKVSGLIHAVYELAVGERDYPTQVMLQWFISEQVEEEKNAETILEQLRLVGDKGTALFMMDRALGARAGSG
jgi:ferritin